MESSTNVVQRWIEAHNDRDLDGMLACVTEDFEFHPLRFIEGAKTSFVGQDELRLWFSRLMRSGSGHELRLSHLEERGMNEVLVVGRIQLPGSSSVADFYGVYELSDGLIRRATHYISDRRTMERLGLIPSPDS
ncbi:MAG TPA: nuclear transport factor 2 family protein [Solirubrobacterales bacterium]